MSALDDVLRAERAALVEDLETLTSEQWGTPSLCAGWSVQDVAGHLAWETGADGRELLGDALRARGRLNTMFAEAAVRWSARGPAVLLAELRRAVATGAKPPATPATTVLVDAVVHGLDVRRPLGLSRPVPPEAFHPVADFCAGARWPSSMLLGGPARRRLAGLRLVAEDQEWAHGEGVEVRASGETALLVLAGRRVDVDELRGPGAATLAARL
jgi:uncharacterized protein (TIGR03083 family)